MTANKKPDERSLRAPTNLHHEKMQHTLPALDFAADALSPFLSAETLSFHHGKHHDAYVTKLNRLLESSDLGELSLKELVKRSDGAVFNNAAQHYNHSFYWRCVAPGGGEPGGDLLAAIHRDCGSVAKLEEDFKNAAKTLFGSGWCWLVADEDRRLHVRQTGNAGCPLTEDETPVLTCDVWEHAYYVDYRNDRPKYVDTFWSGINWSFAGLAFAKPQEIEATILGR
jgi:Fe-Mn family superoxide dismutase